MATFDTSSGTKAITAGGSATFLGAVSFTITSEYKYQMRGTNGGAGDAYVYWWAPAPDPTGIFYANSRSDTTVAFGSLSGIGVVQLRRPLPIP